MGLPKLYPVPGGYPERFPTGRAPGSGQYLADDATVDVGQAEVAAGVAVGEGLVVEAEQVEDRGVEVVDVDGVGHGLVAEVVGGAVDVAPLDASPGEPHGETVVIVVAPVHLAGVGARGGQLDG